MFAEDHEQGNSSFLVKMDCVVGEDDELLKQVETSPVPAENSSPSKKNPGGRR